jgi:hypothetical protein
VPDALGALEPELAAGELEAEVEAELDELLLHPAAARPVHAMASRATTGALLFAKTGITYRTLPLMVAGRKKSGQDEGESGAVFTQTALHGG